MSLSKRILPVALQGGIDRKQNSKLVLQSKLDTLENCVLSEGGVNAEGIPFLTAKKRPGHTKLGKTVLGGDDISSGDALNTFLDELLHFDNETLRSYSPAISSWADKGRVVPVVTNIDTVLRNNREQTQVDSAIAQGTTGGVIVYAWKDSSGGVRASVLDSSAGTPFQVDVELSATGQFPRVVVLQGNIFVVYVEGVNYRQRKLMPTEPLTFEAAVTIATDVHAVTKHHDIAQFNNAAAVFSYRNTGGSVKLAYLTPNGVQGTTLNGYADAITVAENCENSIAVFVNPDNFLIYVAYHNSTSGLSSFGRTSAFDVAYAPVVLDATTAPITRNITMIDESASVTRLYYEVSAAASYNNLIKIQTVTNAGVAGVAAVFKRSVGLASKAFRYSGDIYILATHGSTLQSTYFLIREDGYLISKNLYAIGGGLTDGNHLTRASVLSTGVLFMPVNSRGRLLSANDNVFTLKGISRLDVDFTSQDRFFSAELNKNLHIAGGFVSNYDGLNVTEHGFHLFPENIVATPQVGAGSIANGTYLYYAVFEWIDNKGLLHRSAPSVATSVTMAGANNQVQLVVSTLRLTAKEEANDRAGVSVVWYRTKTLGQVAYRVTSISAPVLNDTSVDTVTFVDTFADASIDSNEILYTTGGVLENFAPPSCSVIAPSKNRVFAVTESGDVIFSKKYVAGEGVAFAEEFTRKVDTQGGRIIAMATMDDKVIALKRDKIFVMAGDGPNDTGGQDSFTEFERVQADVGCVDPNSIANTPVGIMFKSEKGIYLLRRNLSVEYVGSDVEGFNSLTITSADVEDSKNLVVFLTSDSIALAYDYFFKQWFTWTNHGGKDAVIWQGNYVYLRNTFGDCYLEDSSIYTDDGVAIKMRIVTSWIKFGYVQGFGRVYRALFLGDYYSNHKLKIQVGYNYRSYFEPDDNFEFDATDFLPPGYGDGGEYGAAGSTYGGVDDGGETEKDGVYQFDCQPSMQKCEAIRFSIEDIQNTVQGASFSLQEIALEVGLKRGAFKLPEAKRAQ